VDIEEQTDRLMDAMRDSSFAYWNALLSINGILITVFSAVALFGKANVWFVLLLVVASIASSLLLIRNFKEIRAMYKELGLLKFDQWTQMTQEQKEQLQNKDDDGNERIEQREERVEQLLAFQALLIFAILLLPNL
jgi:hypothetical protein